MSFSVSVTTILTQTAPHVSPPGPPLRSFHGRRHLCRIHTHRSQPPPAPQSAPAPVSVSGPCTKESAAQGSAPVPPQPHQLGPVSLPPKPVLRPASFLSSLPGIRGLSSHCTCHLWGVTLSLRHPSPCWNGLQSRGCPPLFLCLHSRALPLLACQLGAPGPLGTLSAPVSRPLRAPGSVPKLWGQLQSERRV